MAHARHRPGCLSVEGPDPASEHRAPLDRRHQHARDLHVDAVDRRSVHLGPQVPPWDALADIAELVGGLQRWVVWDRELRGAVNQLAVGQSASRARVNDRARLGLDLVDRNPPLVGRGLHEHLPRRGARLTPDLEMIPDTPTAPVGLAAGDGVRVERRVGRRLLDADLGEVGVQLVGDDHRHRGQGTLSHLGHRVDDRDDAVAVDRQPLTWRQHPDPLGHGRIADGNAEAEPEPGAERKASLENRAAGQQCFHRPPPCARAFAPCITARTRS